MLAKILAIFLLFTCQIILNESSESVEDETPTTRNPNLPEGYVAFPDVNAAYKLYETESSWTEGRDRCIAEGTHLAIADTVAKIQHINSLKTNPDANKWVHVGIYRLNGTDQWIQVDNDKVLTAVAWAEDNPDGAGECAGISISEDGLVDYGCEWEGEYYACEIAI